MSGTASIDAINLTSVGLYTVPMAAQILREDKNKVRSWVEGYANSNAQPIIRRQLPRIDGKTVLGFLDLVEARFIKHFCDYGLSPQSIRKVSSKLRERHSTDHPFATNKRFQTDGKAVFMEVVETDSERRILNLMNDNFEMGDVIERSLFDTILYAEDLAVRWHPVSSLPRIVLDPKFAFGRPVIEDVWVPTEALYGAFVAEGGHEEAAHEFEVDIDAVRQAVEFERALAEGAPH